MESGTNHLQRLRKAIDGDADALAALLAESHERLIRYVRGKIPVDVSSVVAAEDVVQEVHIAAFRDIGSFEPRQKGSLERWLRTIAIRRLRNAIRFQRQAKRGGGATHVTVSSALERSAVMLLDLLDSPVKSPSRVAAAAEATVAVNEALQALPEDFRLAVRLVYLEGKTVAAAVRSAAKTLIERIQASA